MNESLKSMGASLDSIGAVADAALPKANVTDSTDITESGWAMDARQLNPAISGTLGREVHELRSKEIRIKEIDFKVTTQKDSAGIYFAEIDLATIQGIPENLVACVPIYTSQDSWYKTLAITSIAGTIFRLNGVDNAQPQTYSCKVLCFYTDRLI